MTEVRTILLVEDETLIALGEQMSLEQHGYAVLLAGTGQQAIEAVRSSPQIDLVLMDIDLGDGIDGTEAAKRILEFRDLPVVFLSSHTEPEIVEKTEKITSYGYVVKNLDSTVLEASIRMAFRLFDARTTLLEDERRLENLFENMNDAFALHEVIYDGSGVPVDYRFVEVNDRFLSRLGLRRDELIGHTALELFPETEPVWIESFGRVASTGEPETLSHWAAATKRHYETHLYCPGKGYCAGLFEDVTERERAQEALFHERRILQTIVDTIPVMITRYDPQTRILYLNSEFENKTGWSSADVADVDLMERIYPDSRCREEARVYMQRAVSEWREFDLRTKSGATITSKWSNIRLEDGTQIGIGIDVTADKIATQQLRAHEDRFRSMFDQHNAVMLLIEPETGSIRDANRSAVRYYGYSRDELLRMTIEEINTMPSEEIAELRALAEREQLSHFVFPHRLSNGETRTVEVHSSPIPTEDGIVLFSIIHDITERQRVEEALKESEAEFRRIFDIASVGIVQVNPAVGRILRCNEKYQTITGYTESELLDLSFPELTHPEDRAADWEMFSRAVRDESSSYYNEKRYIRKDGRIIWVRLNANFVRDADGVPVRSVAVCEDITESRDAEERIRQLFAEKETLLKEVQHRVKNTMHTMASLLYIEASRLSDPNAVAAMNDMEGRFKSMELLYDHLYRTESHESASLRDYLTSLVRSVADLFARRDAVRIIVDVDDIELDAKRLSALGMVVNELVTNALKYAFLDRDEGLLEVTGRVRGETIVVTVADDGPGLPDSLDPVAGESYGLTMVHAFAEQLNGTVRFERDSGTRVVVEFGMLYPEP